MPFLVSKHTADWLRSAMGRGRGFGSRPRRIVHAGGSAGGASDAIPCRVISGTEWAQGVVVNLYENGFMEEPTGSGTLYLPEVGQLTKARYGMAVLAHRGSIYSVDTGTDEPQANGGAGA